MSVCQHFVWRRTAPVWKQEDASEENWSEQRKYRAERCSMCEVTRLIRPLGLRRRYRLAHENADQPALLKKLHATQWSTVEALIAELKRNRFEVQALLREWAEAGWAEVEETRIDADWQPERARLSPLLVHTKTEQQIHIRDAQVQQAIESISSTLRHWRVAYQEASRKHYAEHDVMVILTHLYTLFEEQESATATGTCVQLTGTTMQAGGLPHIRWVALLRGILDLLANPRIEHERIFSARWLRDSKAFRKERDALEAFLSIEGGLESIGLVKHTPVVLSWGVWQATWGNFVLDGRAGFSFTATAADTIAQLKNMQVEAEMLFIVENQTPFEILVHPQRRDTRVLYLYGAGFPGQAQRDLVKLWLRAKPTLSWSVWTDYDPGGVAIQQHWHSWSLQEQLSAPNPYRWKLKDLIECQAQGIPLKVEQREQLAKMQHPLAQRLCEWGYAVEQEAILSIHEHW